MTTDKTARRRRTAGKVESRVSAAVLAKRPRKTGRKASRVNDVSLVTDLRKIILVAWWE